MNRLASIVEQVITSRPAVDPMGPPFRLEEAWYRKTTARLQTMLGEKGLVGILLESGANMEYFTGLFCSQTERPFWIFIPAQGEPTILYPYLDRDIVETWWIKDGSWYFDYPHHGPFNKVSFEPGPSEDLLAWMAGELKKRGYGAGKVGIDRELSLSRSARLHEWLPEVDFLPVGDLCLRMRQIKTPEELDLIRRTLRYQCELLDFGRELIIAYGRGVTDYDVYLEMLRYGARLLMDQMQPDGRPHNAVGITLRLRVRSGQATAYPHPNQFCYHAIQPGDAIQITTGVNIGGYMGETYRALQTYPATDLQSRMWDVHTEMTLLQAELSAAGTPCNEVASKVLKLAQQRGMEQYVYHRPAHGLGMEVHQMPCISLGDDTLLEENMIFSNEPGLYNPTGGFGYNHSNTVLVTRERGVYLNKLPMTRDYCWFKI